MLYKHWKKIALALTGFFWASCEDTVTSTAPEYGCPSDGCGQGLDDGSSSSTDDEVSSSSLEHQFMPLYGVSEKVFDSSSSMEESSSSFTEVAPAYGVPGQIACFEDPAAKETLGQGVRTVYRCDDGVTCQEEVNERWVPESECIEDICPDYGVVAITEKTYTCDDGNTYHYAEFISRYKKMGTYKVDEDE